MSLFPSSSYNDHVAVVTAALAIKLMVTKLLVVRARIGSKGLVWKEDTDAMKGWLGNDNHLFQFLRIRLCLSGLIVDC
jgi:hypothetical protein